MILSLRIFICTLVVSLLCCKLAMAQSVNITSITPTPACAGSTVAVTFDNSYTGIGTYTLKLYNANNALVSSITSSNTGWTPRSYTESLPIPAGLPTGTYTVGITRIPFIGSTYNSPNSTPFTVNAKPAAPVVANLDYCLGTTGVPPLTATGQNLRWYTVSTGGAGSTTAPTPPTTTVGATNYYVSQTINGCEGSRATIVVTIRPLPAKPTVTSSLSYCQNATAPALTATGASGSILKWYTTSMGGNASTTAPVPNTSSLSPNPVTYYVSQTDVNGCESDRADITVTIKANPNPPTVTNPAPYCQDQTATSLSATPVTGGTLNWFGPSNNNPLGSTAPTPPTTSPGTTFYSVSQTVSGCTSTAATITVIVNAKPVAPTTKPVGVCQGTTPISLATGVTSGTNLRWYTNAMGGTASTVAPTPPTSSIGSTPYYVSQVNSNNCESDRAVITYTVYAYPTAPTVSPGSLTYCQSSTAVPLTATHATSATLTYYTVATDGTPYSTLTPSTSASNNYYVSQTLNGCESQRATISVVINVLPPRPAVTTPVTYCQFTIAAPLSATASTNNALSWYGTNASGGTASTAAPTPPATQDGAFIYYVTQKDPFGCESDRMPISVTIYPKPAAPAVVPASACLNSVPNPLTQSVTATGTLKWYTVSTGGIGSTVAPTLSTTAVGATSYYVSQTNGSGCESDRTQITFTVNPLPAAPVPTPAKNPLIYCQNETAAPLTATGQNLKWYSLSSGGSALPNPVTPSTAVAGPPVTYYVSQTDANGCESPRASITVTTVSRPAAPTVSTLPVTYCQYATPVSLTATPITGNMLNWYGPNETGGTASATATVPVTDPPGTTRYYVSQTDGNGCESSSRASISVTVNAKPTAPTVNSITLCQNAAPVALATAVTSGTNLKWYTVQTGGTGSTVAPVLSTATVGPTTYYVSQTSADGCESDRSAVLVTVKPLPVAPTITPNPQNLCQSSVPTPLTAIATGTLKWYNVAGQAYTSITPSTNDVGPTTYFVSQIVDGCEGPKATLNVVVIPKPVVPTVSSSLTICQASPSVTLAATGQNLKWYTVSTGGTSSATAPTPPTSASGTTVYYVTQTDANGCESDRASISVRVKPKPAPPGTADISFCSNKVTPLTATFSASPNWYGMNATGGTASATAPTPSTAVIGAPVLYYVSQSLEGCESDRASIAVTIKVLPAAPAVSSTPVLYCQDAVSVPLSATAASNGSLNWYTTQTGSPSSTAPTPQTMASLPPTTYYYVSQTVDGCEGPQARIAVTINPRPTQPTVVSSLSYCQNTTAPALTATGASGNILNWYTSSTGGTGSTTAPTPPTSNAQTPITYYVSQTNANGCESDRAGITVTIVATPAAPGTSSLSLCQNATPVSLVTGVTSGANLQWYTAQTGGTATTVAPTPPTSATGTTTYYVSQSVSGCEGPRASLDVTVKPLPTAPTVAPTPVNYCQNAAAVSLMATASAGGTLNWYISQGGVVSSLGQVSPTPSTTAIGTITYYVSQSVNGCEGPQATINVTINALPSAPTVTYPSNTLNFCQGNAAIQLMATGSAGGVLNWYTVSTGGTPDLKAPTPPTSTTGTTIYYVSQVVNGCESSRTAIVVIVTGTPGAPGTSSLSLCQGAVVTTLTATASPGGILNWYTSVTGGTASAAPTPPTSATGTTTYYVSQSVNGCEGSRASLDLTIKPLPVAPIAGVNSLSYCQGSVATPLVATAGSGGTLNWYISQGGVVSSLGQVAPTPSTATAGVIMYYVSQSVNGCEGPQASITVTIKAPPSAPTTINTSPNFCQNSVATQLVATASPGGVLQWYATATGGTASIAAPVPPTSATGAFPYYVSQLLDGCESARTTITVTITATPGAPGTTPASFCYNAVVTALTATTSPGGILNWYTSATGGTASPSAPVPPTNVVGTTTYYVSQSVNGCESPRTSLDVTIKPLPVAPTVTTGAPSFCQNSAATPLSATPANGGTLNWYTTATGGTASPSAPVPPTNTVGQMTYYVSQTVSGCEGPEASIVVTIKSLPAAPIVSSTPVTLCQNSIATALTAGVSPGGTLNWYTAPTGGVASSIAPIPSTTSTALITYYVSQSVNGCESPLVPIVVIVKLTPSAPTVGTSPIYCQGGTATALSATAPDGGSLNWYTTPTGGTASTTPPVPPVNTLGVVTYYVSQLLSGCEGPRVSLTATIKAAPAAPFATASVAYCQGAAAVALTATPAGGDLLNWYTTPTGGSPSGVAPVPPTSSPGSTQYYVSQTDATGCESVRSAVTVKINALPAVPSTVPVTYCQGSVATALTATLTGGVSLNWYTAAAGGVASPVAPIPVSTSPGSTPYYVSQTDANGCESSRNVVLVTVTPSPAAPVVAAIAPVCQNSPSFAVQAAGQNLKWYTDPTSTASLGSAVLQSTAQPGTFIYYVSQTINSCEGARAQVQVVVNPLPAAPIVANQTGCQDAVVQPLTATGTALQWYDGNDNQISAPTPVTKVDVTQTYTYKVTQTLSGCTSPKATFIYTVNVTPLPTVAPVAAYCQNSLVTPLQATGSNLKWTDPTGVVSANAPTPSTAAVTAGSSYFVTQTSALGCESRPAQIKVAVNAQAVAKLDGNASVYLGSPALLTLTLTGAGPYSYTLSDGTSGIAETSITSPITTKQVSVTPAATTTYTIAAVANACGIGPSSGAATVTVKVPTLTTSALSASLVCTGTSFTVPFSTTGEFVTGNAFTVEIGSTVGDSASRKYIPISNGVVQGPFITTTIPSTIAPGQYYVRVVASNAPYSIGGTVSPTVLTVRPLPTASFSASKNAIYKGESIILVFSLGGDGPWTGTYSAGTEVRAFGATTSVYSATLTPATTTTYKLLSIANGCGTGKLEGVDTTTVRVDILTAEEDPFVNSVKVYPVPTDGAVTVDIDVPLQSKPAELRLIGPSGRTTGQVTTKKRQTILDLSKEPAGTYLLYITVGDRSTVRKILKL